MQIILASDGGGAPYSHGDMDVYLNSVWQIAPNLKCPLIGLCLSEKEQVRILKKSGVSVKRKAAYHIHRNLMARMDKENGVSVRVDKMIRHKFRTQIAAFAAMDEDELRKRWQAAFPEGDIEALFFVIAVRSDMSMDFLQDVYGDVHMMGHLHMTTLVDERKKTAAIRNSLNQYVIRLSREKDRCKALARKMRSTEKALNDVKARMMKLEKEAAEKSSVRHGGVEKRASTHRIEDLETKLAIKTDAEEQIERDKRKLQIRCFELQATNDTLVEEINGLLVQLAGTLRCANGCDETCPRFRLCEKRILIVGGMTRIKPFYQKLIESNGGKLDYHDGYMKGGNKNLEDRVMKSDLILCPVNCNSHNACLKVKKLCKKYNKTVRMLPGSGLSTISAALAESLEPLN